MGNNKTKDKKSGGGGILNLSKGKMSSDLKMMGIEGDLEDFERKPILDWDVDDIAEWIACIEFDELKDIILGKVKNGNELFELSFQDPIFSEVEEGTKKAFFIYLYHLKQCVKPRKKEDQPCLFSLKFHRVCKKILRGVGVDEFKFKHMEAHCSVLSDRNRIKKYLLDQKNAEQKLKVKLIITESIFNPKEQLLRQIVSPIVNMIPSFRPEFGLFHSAILLGPFYLHWTDSELVIPKKIESGAAFISIDTDPLTIEGEQQFDEVKAKIAKVIEIWNTSRTYAQMPKKGGEGNCQDFIFEMCSELGINLNLDEGSFAEYLKKLKKKGAYKIQFKPSKQFEEEFNLKAYEHFDQFKKTKDGNRLKIDFETHAQLDDFLYYCYTTNTMAIKKFRDEYRLLKSFDRAFWLRHLKDNSDERWKPAPESQGRSFGRVSKFRSGCPFEDPRITGSYDN